MTVAQQELTKKCFKTARGILSGSLLFDGLKSRSFFPQHKERKWQIIEYELSNLGARKGSCQLCED